MPTERGAIVKRVLKAGLATGIAIIYRAINPILDRWGSCLSLAKLASRLKHHVPFSTIILGEAEVRGTGNVKLGNSVLCYPDVCFETRGQGQIVAGEHVVFSKGVHIIAHEHISIGKGTLIGEYTSIRDQNHRYHVNSPIWDSGYISKPVRIGENVWIGRGVCVLPGVTIGSNAVVGANAVVTHDVKENSVVAGIPAIPISKES